VGDGRDGGYRSAGHGRDAGHGSARCRRSGSHAAVYVELNSDVVLRRGHGVWFGRSRPAAQQVSRGAASRSAVCRVVIEAAGGCQSCRASIRSWCGTTNKRRGPISATQVKMTLCMAKRACICWRDVCGGCGTRDAASATCALPVNNAKFPNLELPESAMHFAPLPTLAASNLLPYANHSTRLPFRELRFLRWPQPPIRSFKPTQ
jgi:hypothetical protein